MSESYLYHSLLRAYLYRDEWLLVVDVDQHIIARRLAVIFCSKRVRATVPHDAFHCCTLFNVPDVFPQSLTVCLYCAHTMHKLRLHCTDAYCAKTVPTLWLHWAHTMQFGPFLSNHLTIPLCVLLSVLARLLTELRLLKMYFYQMAFAFSLNSINCFVSVARCPHFDFICQFIR